MLKILFKLVFLWRLIYTLDNSQRDIYTNGSSNMYKTLIVQVCLVLNEVDTPAPVQ
jgi:hypothetical protein